MKARQFVQDSYSLGRERRKHSRKIQGKMRKAVHWIPAVLVVVLGTNNGGRIRHDDKKSLDIASY